MIDERVSAHESLMSLIHCDTNSASLAAASLSFSAGSTVQSTERITISMA